MFCVHCGNELDSTSPICPKCGVSLAGPKGLSGHVSFWMLFLAAIFFFFSLMMNDIAIDHLYAEQGNHPVVFLSFDFTFLAYAFYFAILIFCFCLVGYLTSYNAVKRHLCSKSYPMVALGALICSIVYLLAKLILIS